jgi:hypothetical protein
MQDVFLRMKVAANIRFFCENGKDILKKLHFFG